MSSGFHKIHEAGAYRWLTTIESRQHPGDRFTVLGNRSDGPSAVSTVGWEQYRFNGEVFDIHADGRIDGTVNVYVWPGGFDDGWIR